MTDYRVIWEIDAFGVNSPREAAEQARAAQTRKGTSAVVVFDVTDPDGVVTRVDLQGDVGDDYTLWSGARKAPSRTHPLVFQAENYQSCRDLGRHAFPSGGPKSQPGGTSEVCPRCGTERHVDNAGLAFYARLPSAIRAEPGGAVVSTRFWESGTGLIVRLSDVQSALLTGPRSTDLEIVLRSKTGPVVLRGTGPDDIDVIKSARALYDSLTAALRSAEPS
jgi:hypothetical protein